jgi:glucose-1-phosphate thymidylyltransferase
MKGIILAGGSGTRLHPITKSVTKQLLPVYDKPMIYYPLSVLMLAGIREIMIITCEDDLHSFKKLLNNGSELGLSIEYSVQKDPKGIAEAFIIAEEFIGKSSVCLVLGDNLFYGTGLVESLQRARDNNKGALIFGCYVSNPSEFGVVDIDDHNRVLSIEEKPEKPKSNYAVPGLYFYNNEVVEIAKNIEPSERGELEITAVNNEYLKMGLLDIEILSRGTAWMDMGNCKSLLNASVFVDAIQSRQGLYIACIEEIAYRMGYIDKVQLRNLADRMIKTEYGKYLEMIYETQ